MSLTAVPLPKLEPGSPEWMTKMTASKVAAVLGLSPWESRFSLWHRMAGLVEPDGDSDQKRRGHYLEDGVARWFADQHREFDVEPGGAWAHRLRSWQAASPDRLLHGGPDYETYRSDDPNDNEVFCSNCLAGVESTEHNESCIEAPAALLEIKTDAYPDGWGAPGTDQIPPYYRAQVVWQMDTLGVPVCYVAVLLGQGLKFAEYVVHYDADEAGYIRAEAKAFMDSLPGGPAEQRPDVDDHSQTYDVIRQLNPDIDGEIHIPDDLAQRYISAVTASKAVKKIEQQACSELADHMGAAKKALWLGKPIASRQQRNGGTPYLVAARNFPTLDIPEEILSA